MSLAIQKERLRRLVQAMYIEGIVNAAFCELQSMKEVIQPDFVVRAITLYCLAAQNLFSLLTSQLDQTDIDFYQVQVYARDLLERSSSVGAENVMIACADLILASQANDKDYCSRALNSTKNDFSRLRRDLETIVQVPAKSMQLVYVRI
ncbi:histidine-containing phosphotransfer protein 1-like [Cornus florida]|uniref:histidine-containing phosphotransfer protein 1-like n=1 Tax=Cornus florida TaxID=4283 RepID=UPI00289842FC|nr:histidine-containing phosphotransfer protein 1-like [Cornus florida]